MSDLTRNLIDAIIAGKATEIESIFQSTLADKLSSAMEDRKLEVAQGMFKESTKSLDESLIDSYKEHASFSDKLRHLNDIHKKLSNAGYKTTDKLDPKAENSPVTYHKAGAGSIEVSHGGMSGTSPQEKAGWSAPLIFTSVKKFGMSNAPRD